MHAQDEATAPATVDGMLGEYGFVSKDDLSESLGFLEAIQEMRPELNFGSAVGECLPSSVSPTVASLPYASC